MAWSVPQKLVQDGAIGRVRYISAIVPSTRVKTTHFGALSILAPSREIKTEKSWHSITGALSMRSEIEGGAQIAIASASEGTAPRITIEGSEGRIHIVDGVVSVQSRGEWREFVV